MDSKQIEGGKMETQYIVVLEDGRFLTNGMMLSAEYPEARLFDYKREANACAKAIKSAHALTTAQYEEQC